MRRSEIFHYQKVALLSGFLTIGQGERQSLQVRDTVSPGGGESKIKGSILGKSRKHNFG